ncbi:DUF397 domain-containing protein [Streptomyces xiaopingdaonensis]|uniref:DUF397 domain-containing protein n=1 Tax=Streptomyces xiaopingdaonensis TaxID=1565415 RepID=UPI0002F1A871|nr:DUF397 domain-containing protein [Streptomyces xiaopingdaonensis]
MTSARDLPAKSWCKSSYSGQGGGNCLEVAAGSPNVAVRDSKDPDGAALLVPPGAWRAFVGQVRAREL